MKAVTLMQINHRMGRLSALIDNRLTRFTKNQYKFETSWALVFKTLQDNEELTVKDLASILEVTPSATCQTIKSLESKHLVNVRVGADKRNKLVKLTAQGRKLFNRYLEDTAIIYKGLDQDALAKLTKDLQLLEQSLLSL